MDIDQARTNLDAMPPVPRAGSRATEWMMNGGALFDGDYVTLRSKAWGGVTIAHSWSGNGRGNGTSVTGEQKAKGELKMKSPMSMANKYSFCIRVMYFDNNKKAWFLKRRADAWKDKIPIAKTDHVCFLVPNDPNMALGTRDPPNGWANNGDYQCELVPMPVCNVDEITAHTPLGMLRTWVSPGLWRGSKDAVDFLSQSRAVWSFHSIGPDNSQNLTINGNAINIRNMWTAIKSQETTIWNYAGHGIVAYAINKTFNGGRNLTMAAGSGGRTVKLALHNKDADDKAGWIINHWAGVSPVAAQRVAAPRTVPFTCVGSGRIEEMPAVEYQRLVERIRAGEVVEDAPCIPVVPQAPPPDPTPVNPTAPPRVPVAPTPITDIPTPVLGPNQTITTCRERNMTLSPETGQCEYSGLVEALEAQNAPGLLDHIATLLGFGRWRDVPYTYKIGVAAGVATVSYFSISSTIPRLAGRYL